VTERREFTGPTEPHPRTGQPVGLPVDTTPADRPGPVTLTGRFGRLEKLTAHHAPALWDAVKGHDAIWTYMPGYGPFTDAADFIAWVERRTTLSDPYSYAIVGTDGHALGICTLMEIRPASRVCEIGHVLYAPALQHSPLATEAQYLIAQYAFETLRYRRYEWKCDNNNAASKRAALRLGFGHEFVMRQHVIAKGRNRDTAWFSMLDSDWPARKARFERWLAPDNFDASGRQKTRLSELPL